MATTFELAVALSGGGALVRSLGAIGDASQKALKELEAAADSAATPMEKMRLSVKKLEGSLKDAQKAGKEFREAWSGLASSVGTVAGRLSAVAGALSLAGAAVSTAIWRTSSATVAAVDQQARASEALGVSVEEYGRLAAAADEVDVGPEQLSLGLKSLSDVIAGAFSGSSKEAINLFNKLGIVIRSSKDYSEDAVEYWKGLEDWGQLPEGAERVQLWETLFAKSEPRNTVSVLNDIANAFQKMPDGAQKAALALDLFGKAGLTFIPFLNQGAAGLREVGDRAVEAGLVFSEAQQEAAAGFDDAMDEMAQAFQGLRNSVGFVFIPALTDGMVAVTQWVIANRRAIADFVSAGWDRALAVVRDLVALWEGRDADVQNAWIIQARDRVVEFGSAVYSTVMNDVIPAIKEIKGQMDEVARIINSVLGTGFSGDDLGLVIAFGALAGIFSAALQALVALARGVQMAITLAPALAAAWASVTAAVQVGLSAVAGFLGAPAILVALFVAAAAAIIYYWDEIGAAGVAAWQVVQETAGSAAATIKAAWTAAGEWLSGLWAGVTATAATAWETVKAIVAGAWEAAKGGGVAFLDWLGGVGSAIVNALTWPFQQAASVIADLWQGVRAMIERVVSLAQSAASAVGWGGDEPSGPDGYAQGGPVRGPGTGTSDSVLARLSDGEFVVRAAAVQRYGVGFLSRLNALALPRYAGGGLVSALTDSLGSLNAPLAGLPEDLGVQTPSSANTLILHLNNRPVEVPTTADALKRLADAGRLQVATPPRWK